MMEADKGRPVRIERSKEWWVSKAAKEAEVFIGAGGMLVAEKPWRAMKPDGQAFDEVRIRTQPRFKESGLSGDEWRISAAIEFWRKGQLVHETGYGRNVESAVMGLGYKYHEAIDGGRGMFAGEGNTCDQEGCCQTAKWRHWLKAEYGRDGKRTELSRPEYRLFCDRHKVRGDCGLDDADANYTVEPYEKPDAR